MTKLARKTSWTKNTGYPVLTERRPSEVKQATKAVLNSMSYDLDSRKRSIDKSCRDTINTLNIKRNRLEKSMLAYCEKMREINLNRLNSLPESPQIMLDDLPFRKVSKSVVLDSLETSSVSTCATTFTPKRRNYRFSLNHLPSLTNRDLGSLQTRVHSPDHMSLCSEPVGGNTPRCVRFNLERRPSSTDNAELKEFSRTLNAKRATQIASKALVSRLSRTSLNAISRTDNTVVDSTNNHHSNLKSNSYTNHTNQSDTLTPGLKRKYASGNTSDSAISQNNASEE